MEESFSLWSRTYGYKSSISILLDMYGQRIFKGTFQTNETPYSLVLDPVYSIWVDLIWAAERSLSWHSFLLNVHESMLRANEYTLERWARMAYWNPSSGSINGAKWITSKPWKSSAIQLVANESEP